jgi:hypothetical protein
VSLAWTIARLLAVALPLYFAWEMLRAPAFTGMPKGSLAASAVCALAAAGDGAIVLVVYTVLGLVFRDARWFVPPRLTRYAALVLVGVSIQAAVEWIMIHRLGRWGYKPSQPLVPLLDIGVLPFLQPAVLLPLTVWIFARWEARATRDSSAPQRVGASTW